MTAEEILDRAIGPTAESQLGRLVITAESILDRQAEPFPFKGPNYSAQAAEEIEPGVLGRTQPLVDPTDVAVAAATGGAGLLPRFASAGATAATEAVGGLASDAGLPWWGQMGLGLGVGIATGKAIGNLGTMRAPTTPAPHITVPSRGNPTLSVGSLPTIPAASLAPNLPEVAPISQVEPPGAFGKARIATSGAERVLLRSPSQAARRGGEVIGDIDVTNRMKSIPREAIVHRALAHLSKAERLQVDATLRGEQAPSDRVFKAASIIRDEILDPFKDDLIAHGVPTKTVEGKLTPFMPRTNYAPEYAPEGAELVSLSRKFRGMGAADVTQHQRVGGSREIERDPAVWLPRYIVSNARKVAIHKALPGSVDEPVAKRAEDVYRAIVADNRPLEAALYEKTVGPLVQRLEQGGIETLGGPLNWLARATARGSLGLASVKQISQMGSNVAIAGVGNTLRGIPEYMMSPRLRANYAASGAMDSGLLEYVKGGSRGLTTRLLSGMEHMLRGPLASGAAPYVRGLARQSAEFLETGTKPNAALLMKLRELRLDPDALGGEWRALGGDLSDETWRTVLQRFSNMTQLRAGGIGQIGEAFQGPVGRFLFQFDPFGINQARFAHQQILEPLGSGMKAALGGDFSLLGTGIARAGRYLPVTAGLATGVELTLAAIRRKDLSDPQVQKDVAIGVGGSVAGYPAMAAGEIARALGHRENPLENMVIPPAIRYWGNIPLDLARGRFGEAATDIGAALDPTGILPVIRPTIKGTLRQERERERRSVTR